MNTTKPAHQPTPSPCVLSAPLDVISVPLLRVQAAQKIIDIFARYVSRGAPSREATFHVLDVLNEALAGAFEDIASDAVNNALMSCNANPAYISLNGSVLLGEDEDDDQDAEDAAQDCEVCQSIPTINLDGSLIAPEGIPQP